jgi:hypothetical protein
MSSTFLNKLFKHSKWAFVCAILYMVAYFTCIFKKMDMAIFPYNNMYSNAQTIETPCYYLKMNNQRISYTHFMYWKKDFLEQSVTKYAGYVNQNQHNYLNIYIDEKIKYTKQNSVLKKALTPGEIDFKSWSTWYATYAGIKVQPNDNFELVKYNVEIKNDVVAILDSNVLCSTKTKKDD